MRILVDAEKMVLTLVSVTEEESATLSAIIQKIKPEDFLKYGGRRKDPDNEDFCTVILHAGGESNWVTEQASANVSVTCEKITGSVKLELVGTTTDDKYAIGSIRNACYFATGGLIFLGGTSHEGKPAITVTGARCKHCAVNLIDFGRCEWETCAKCADACDHEYKNGMIHGGGLDLAVGEFCTKCGRVKPLEEGKRKKSVIEQHLAVERELGMSVVYKDGPPNTPTDAVQLMRLARRHEKANRT